MKNFIEKNTFWIILIISLVMSAIIAYNQIGSWNLNRTIGWGWDVTNFLWWIMPSVICSFFLLTLGYGILYFNRRRTSFLLSSFQFFLMFFIVGMIPFNTSLFFLILMILQWLFFGLNFYYSEKIIKTDY